VLSITPFRRLWVALSLSSLGDWLSLVALSTLAVKIGGTSNGAYAVSGVWLTSLLPALLFGPLAGAVADKFDRRLNMIIGDVIRAALYITIPLNLTFGFVGGPGGQLTWIYVVQFLASCASLFWTPAKDASVPNLVPPDKLEQANQLSLFTTYGTAPVAGLLFTVLALISQALSTSQYDLALYFNAATFLVSALTVFMLRELRSRRREVISAPSVLRSIWEGWRFLRQTPVVRGILLGLTGAFAAGGVVVGLGPSYVRNNLEGCAANSASGCGSAGWGAVFAAIFLGLAVGMFLGLRALRGLSRRRLFGLSIMSAAVPLAVIALIPSLILTVILTVVLGACAGAAYVTGYTVIGLEVDDDTRGRTFAFLQSAIRVILFAAIAIAPTLAGGFNSLAGGAGLHIGGFDYRKVGYNVVLLLAAAVAIALGRMAYRQMDDRTGVPLLVDLGSLFRPDREESVNSHRKERRWARFRQAAPDESVAQTGNSAAMRRPGVFLALEGGEGAGKSTQARLLAIWLREQGYDVVTTHEPGATKIGLRLRALLLDTAHVGLAPRAEALMYAADRAEHVQDVILPALERGAVVVTDRYVDSSLAYQGAGRQLPVSEIASLNRWATGGLTPDLTILLDLPTVTGLSRRLSSADRLESEPVEFHERVRSGFLSLAATEPGRYLVVDADRPESEISREIQLRVRELLPDPIPFSAEENTGSFPAVRE